MERERVRWSQADIPEGELVDCHIDLEVTDQEPSPPEEMWQSKSQTAAWQSEGHTSVQCDEGRQSSSKDTNDEPCQMDSNVRSSGGEQCRGDIEVRQVKPLELEVARLASVEVVGGEPRSFILRMADSGYRKRLDLALKQVSSIHWETGSD